MGTSSTKAKNKYNLKNYDVITLRLKKGIKENIEFFANVSGKSLNAFITENIIDTINKNKASQAVQVRTNIRFKNEISYFTLAKIFKNPSLFNNEKHLKYFLAFFESCYPSLIKKFMEEQNISRKEIMTIFNMMPKTCGEIIMFKENIKNGQF